MIFRVFLSHFCSFSCWFFDDCAPRWPQEEVILMREWLLGLVPAAIIIDLALNPSHLAWAVSMMRHLLR